MKSRQSDQGLGPCESREQPLVSVILPVYNVAPYLREALDSAVSQTYPRLEIIIVDDGSTDGSQALCDAYLSDPRVQVIHQAHRGVSNARNTALDRATGDYIAFLDPDDAYHPDFVRRMLEAIGDADAVECRHAKHKLTLNLKGQPAPLAKTSSYNREDALRAHVKGLISTSVCNKLFRKALWKDIRFPDGHNYEDIDVVYRVLNLCSRVNTLDQGLYFYRMRPGSITHTNTRENCEDWILAMEHLAAFVEANTPGIFDETHLRKIRQSRMNKAFKSFIQGHMDANDVHTVYESVNPETLSFRSRVAYRMVRCCPGLMKALYPVYHAFRLAELKVLRR